jgi:hypothetical protein
MAVAAAEDLPKDATPLERFTHSTTTKEGVEISTGPPMPPLIEAWIHEDFNALDQDGAAMIESFKSNVSESVRLLLKDHF